MTALLTGLRNRPWLAACILFVSMGLGLVAIDSGIRGRYSHFLLWAGIAVLAGALLIALGAEIRYRRQRAGQVREP